MNITSTKVKLLLIRYRINLAIQVPNVRQIIIITDAIPAARCIFDLSNHLFQLYSIVVFQDLRAFFNGNSNNIISFWDCLSSNKWPPHLAVDKKTKQLKINPIFLCKSSWDFSKKEEYNIILKNCVRRGSHRGRSLQNVLGDERTCGTTLASAYVLCRLSAAWSQLQMKEGSPSGSEC